MPKKLKPEDEALWDAVTRDVAPIKRSRSQAPAPKRIPVRETGTRRTTEDRTPLPPVTGTPAPQSLHRLDGARSRKLTRGQLPIDGRLDLHGLTQEKAYRTLNRFLARAQAEGTRVILVITGKGGAPKPDPDNIFRDTRTGVLRAMVPQWLADGDNARRVTAWHPAHPKHGGDGALYVVLKRLR